MKDNTCRARLRARLGTLLLLASGAALAIDTEPGNYVPRPAGSNAASIYYQNILRSENHAGGNVIGRNFALDSDIATLKFAHYMQLGDYTVAPGFIESCGSTRASGSLAALGRTSGCMDLIFGAIVWTVNDPAAGRYLAISPYAVAPTGDYDRKRALNMGENRWKYGINAGYVTPLVDRFFLDLVGDIVSNGRNADYGAAGLPLDQGVVFNVQVHLRYQFDAATRVSFSYMQDWGGETTINGLDQNNRKYQGRYRLGAAKFFDRRNQLQFEFGADTKVENGFKEMRRSTLRYLHLF